MKICSKEYKTKKEAEAKLQEFINQLNNDGFLKELKVGTDVENNEKYRKIYIYGPKKEEAEIRNVKELPINQEYSGLYKKITFEVHDEAIHKKYFIDKIFNNLRKIDNLSYTMFKSGFERDENAKEETQTSSSQGGGSMIRRRLPIYREQRHLNLILVIQITTITSLNSNISSNNTVVKLQKKDKYEPSKDIIKVEEPSRPSTYKPAERKGHYHLYMEAHNFEQVKFYILRKLNELKADSGDGAGLETLIYNIKRGLYEANNLPKKSLYSGGSRRSKLNRGRKSKRSRRRKMRGGLENKICFKKKK